MTTPLARIYPPADMSHWTYGLVCELYEFAMVAHALPDSVKYQRWAELVGEVIQLKRRGGRDWIKFVNTFHDAEESFL